MATAIMMLMLVMIAFVVTPMIGEMNHGAMHRIDLMAGGEGIE